MFICEKCGSIYLRKSDAEKCMNKFIEKPLIEVGKILSSLAYDCEFEVRCYAIKRNGHELLYFFESPDEENSWSYVFTIHGNEHLFRNYGKQIT